RLALIQGYGLSAFCNSTMKFAPAWATLASSAPASSRPSKSDNCAFISLTRQNPLHKLIYQIKACSLRDLCSESGSTNWGRSYDICSTISASLLCWHPVDGRRPGRVGSRLRMETLHILRRERHADKSPSYFRGGSHQGDQRATQS